MCSHKTRNKQKGRPTAPCCCRLHIQISCWPQGQHIITKINLPENYNSDHVFHKVHKYTHFEQQYYFYDIDGINITKVFILTLLANLAQHTTAITVLAGLPSTPTNLTSHGLHAVGTSTSTVRRSTPRSITTDKIRVYLMRSTDREMKKRLISVFTRAHHYFQFSATWTQSDYYSVLMTQFSIIPQSPSGFPDNSMGISFLPHACLIPNISFTWTQLPEKSLWYLRNNFFWSVWTDRHCGLIIVITRNIQWRKISEDTLKWRQYTFFWNVGTFNINKL